jgi:L-fuculose-phosphate aldolase
MSAHSDLIDQLSDVGRTAVAQGLVLASGGNLSARLPGSDEFVVTGTGTYLDRLAPDAFSLLGLDGEVRGGNSRPSTEWKLHQRTYNVRPDVNAVIHLHPQHTSCWMRSGMKYA